ncbi:hypothetical protein [Streptomyces subrutilus]|uniref:hypothetical protein n=1 Tax=Streptomyces subrutilus TaxID=36818 RepID=UPI0033E52A18
MVDVPGAQNVIKAAQEAPQTIEKLASSNDPKEKNLGMALKDALKGIPGIGGSTGGLA